MRCVILCLLFSVVAISADLRADFDDILTHLPVEQIEHLGQEYVSRYPVYAKAIRQSANTPYEKLVKDFVQTKDGQKLVEFLQRRGIDGESVMLYFINLSNQFTRKWLESPGESDGSDLDISGDFMADFRKIIASSNVREVIHQTMETNPEFANFVAAVTDPGFKLLFYRSVYSMPLYEMGANANMRGFWSELWQAIQTVAKIVTAVSTVLFAG